MHAIIPSPGGAVFAFRDEFKDAVGRASAKGVTFRVRFASDDSAQSGEDGIATIFVGGFAKNPENYQAVRYFGRTLASVRL